MPTEEKHPIDSTRRVPPGIDLAGQTAVVTGGAAGIGLAIVNRLLEAGAREFIWDLDEDRATTTARDLAGAGDDVRVFQVDVADAASVTAAADRTLTEAPVDILVNNAGISGPNATVWEYPVEEWEAVIRVDLQGTFLCCRALVPAMRERDYGRIVNIASVAGKEGNPNASAYSAAKAGVIALTKSLGKELADTGITCNCVTPAAVETGIFEQMSAEHVQYMLSKIPMGRFGTVEEVASLVTWLCSRECSFSTGAVFDISGGRATY